MPLPPQNLPPLVSNQIFQGDGPENSLGTFILPYKDEPLVQAEMLRFGSPAGKAWLNQGLSRSIRYRSFIINELDRRKMPRNLVWLVMIESVFLENARSSSGAAGLWQFMKNSIGQVMRINDWIDERYDFWKSTDAALTKLAYNYQETGDWLLAIAAYNAGLGRIKRLLKEHPQADFWYLANNQVMPKETSRYVPRFIVVTYLCNNAVSQGLSYGWEESETWTRIRVPSYLSLSDIEKRAGMTPGRLLSANTELRGGLTPPPELMYSLKIPLSYLNAIQAAVKNAPYQGGNPVHRIQSGDTLYGISRSYGVSMESILAMNPGLNTAKLVPGTTIKIPVQVLETKDD